MLVLTLAHRRLTSKYFDLVSAQIHSRLIRCHLAPEDSRNVIVTPKEFEYGKDRPRGKKSIERRLV
jgi:hypothetical protein